MEAARHPAVDPRELSFAEAGATAGEIPTLKIGIEAAEIPTLETPIEALRDVGDQPLAGRPRAAGARERQLPPFSSRRSSRSIITAVALGLVTVIFLVSVLDTLVAGDTATGPGEARPRLSEFQVPTLVLLNESVRPPTPPLASTQLLESTAELLRTRELYDQATIDFALHALKATMLTHANQGVPRQRLEDLTKRLADEGRMQWNQGNAALATRLIQQASDSGVASEYARLAADYIGTPRTRNPGL